jgi:hypothetical protein
MRYRFLARTALACAAATQVQAAPLDALLTALPPTAPLRWDIDAGYDMANKSVDVLGLRPKRADGSYGPSGDYRGGHLLLGGQLTPGLRLEAGLWKRSIAYVSAAADVTTWQLAGQWQALQSASGHSALALRLGGWGNRSPLLRRTSSAVVQGTTFTSAQATNPRDTQFQLDLVASTKLGASLQASAFAGVGHSRVDFDKVSATAKGGNDCIYDVQFEDGKVIATCEQGGASVRISTPAEVYGINVDKEARYTSRFFNLGANAVWQPGDWRLRAGVQHIRIQRQGVDEVVLARGGLAFRSNTIGVAELGYRVLPASLLFLRAQVMAHQFVGEAPLMYNTLTATQHRRRYGIATVGLSHSF